MSIENDKELGMTIGRLIRMIALAKGENKNLSIGAYTQIYNIPLITRRFYGSMQEMEKKKIDIDEIIKIYDLACDYIKKQKILKMTDGIKTGLYIGYFKTKKKK